MKICRAAFNIYLLAILMAWATGCETTKPAADTATTKPSKANRKKFTLLRLHLQANPDGTDHTAQVAIYRKNPMTMTVNSSPFLSEANVMAASVVEDHDVLAIRIQFDRTGAMMLENVTTAYKDSWIAIFANFTEPRWRAAPYVDHRITDGVLTFTPDATREEAQRIVDGLNNVAKKLENAPPADKTKSK
ncbi:MAG: hypothetical protein HYZ36_07420 [Pedosphaera parvula]|nr:hypothetical protein [Pedosphaera parvula]